MLRGLSKSETSYIGPCHHSTRNVTWPEGNVTMPSDSPTTS
jgi:hypothetical protein